jgi:hypothetical protein
MNQDDLVNSLKKIRKKLCAYIGSPCDCKFITDETDDNQVCGRSENGSGCPEVLYAAALINAMTPAELRKICKRAGVALDPSEKPIKRSHKVKIDNETRKIIDKLPDEVVFAVKRSFENAISNISKQIDKATEKSVETQSKSDRY